MGVAAVVGVVALAGTARAQTVQDLSKMSIEGLANIEITSVEKRPELLSQAPAAVYVITHDDIVRSGATSLPEALRLAPNLEVARINSHDYTISARGFNSVNASDKLLVLIDGRSIYSPFFHDVLWDQNQIMLDDIDRIEVISGLGGTLWGANAVNGVINIITKSSRDTQGGLVDANAGTFEHGGAGRWGGKLGENGTYRAYVMGFERGQTKNAITGAGAGDGWSGRQAGFRTDWTGRADDLTVQGDIFENPFDTGGRSNGGNILGRWTRHLDDGASLQVQSYYDVADEQQGNAFRDNVDTYDLQMQETLPLGTRHEVVWGLGQRVWSDAFMPINTAVIVPSNEALALTNVFAQDTITLLPTLKLTLGSKFEYNTFSGFEPMPSARLAWQPSPKNLVWAAVSRAVETPSRLDRDLVIPGLFGPSPEFQSEKLIAYETGYRTEISDRASLSVSLYYNDYSDIRTTSVNTAGTPPLVFANDLEGHTYGAELWGDFKLFPWWRLSPGVDLLHKSLHLKSGGTDIAGVQTAAGIDPGHQFFLRSYFQVSRAVNFYLGLRQIGSLALAHVPAYFEADARLAWQITPTLELSITGENLVHAHHVEATSGVATSSGTLISNSIPRMVLVGLRKSF